MSLRDKPARTPKGIDLSAYAVQRELLAALVNPLSQLGEVGQGQPLCRRSISSILLTTEE
jgi:hypothetical protein